MTSNHRWDRRDKEYRGAWVTGAKKDVHSPTEAKDDAAAGPKREHPGKESGAALDSPPGRMRATAEAPRPPVSPDNENRPHQARKYHDHARHPKHQCICIDSAFWRDDL